MVATENTTEKPSVAQNISTVIYNKKYILKHDPTVTQKAHIKIKVTQTKTYTHQCSVDSKSRLLGFFSLFNADNID